MQNFRFQIKNLVIGICLFIIIVGLLVFSAVAFLGCGSSTSSSSSGGSSGGTVDSTYVGMAQAGVILANGSSSVGTSANQVGTMASTKTTGSLSVKSEDGPPDSFFEPIPSDGWMTVTSEAVEGNMVPYMRLKNRAGQVIKPSFLSGKKVIRFPTLTWKEIMSAGQGQAPAGISLEVQSIIQTYMQSGIPGLTFDDVSSMGLYIAWAFIAEKMKEGPMIPSPLYFSTPEASDNDKIGSMECRMLFTKSASGEVIVTIATELGGKPVAGTYSGTGTLEVGSVTLNVTVTMVFSTSGPPTSVSITGTASDGKVVEISLNPSTGTGSGTLKDSSGNTIGTIDATSTGGSITVGGTKQSFTL